MKRSNSEIQGCRIWGIVKKWQQLTYFNFYFNKTNINDNLSIAYNQIKPIVNIRANSIKNGAFVEKIEDFVENVDKNDRISEFHPK